MNIQALASLSQFTGTTQYHRHSGLFPFMVHSDGVHHLIENADCYWLLDVIASHQPACQKDPSLRGMQFWTIKKSTGTNKEAVVICERDADDVFLSQTIPMTDFPFETLGNEFKLWVAPTEMYGKRALVCYLPSEH